MKNTVRQPKITVSADGKGIVSQAGGLLLAETLRVTGLGTGLAKLRVLGWRPLCVGLAAAALVGGAGFGLIYLLVPRT